jgi:hypothetical protein
MTSKVPGLAVLGVALLLPLLAAGGESAEESEHVGAAQCGACHQAEYEAWKASPHARALEKLGAAEQKDARCRQCHTTTPEESDPALAGVQCEACHGRGRYYSPRWIMKDAELRARLFFEKGGPQTCARCHNETTPSLRPFSYEEGMRALNHGKAFMQQPDGGLSEGTQP